MKHFHKRATPLWTASGAAGNGPRAPPPRAGATAEGENGAWGRIRTTDTRIFSPLLYQLSYPGPWREERRL